MRALKRLLGPGMVMFFAMVLFLFPPLYSQVQRPPDSLRSVEQEIRERPETDNILLGKARATLFESLTVADTAKARRIVEYMFGKFDTSRVVIFFPYEALLMKYWLKEFGDVFEFVRHPQWLLPRDIGKIVLDRDLLSLEIRMTSSNHIGLLAATIRTSDLPMEKKEFLGLFLQNLLGPEGSGDDAEQAFHKGINLQSDQFLADYPNSEYVPFVRENIRYVIVRSDWGYGYEIGGGYLGLPGTLSHYLDDYGVLTMAVEGTYKDHLYGCLRLDIGAEHGTKKEFEHNGIWPKGVKTSEVGVLLAFGPMIRSAGGIVLTPHAGFGYTEFSPPESEHLDLSLGFAIWGVGLNTDFLLNDNEGSLYIRAYAGYRHSITTIDMARGGYLHLSISIGYIERPSVRDY